MKIKLDSNLAVPLFMQLAAALKEEIARGRWKPGDVLPTVRELSQNYSQASVKTSRRALEVLAKEGWTKPRRRVGSVVMDRGIDVRTKGRVLILTNDPCHGYYHMRFLLVLGHRFRKHGYGLVPIRCGERGDAMPIRRVAEVLKERWSFVLVMGNADEARRVVVESERPFALVGNGAPLSRFSAPLCAGRFEVRCEKAIPGFVRECVRRRISRVVQFKYAAGAFDVAGQLSYAGIATETVTIPPKPSLEGIVRASFSAMRRQVAKRDLPELFIFTDDYVAQGALMALALAGVRLPDDVAVVTHSNKGITPIWEKPLARLEMDPTAHARAVADAVVDYLYTGVPRDLDLGSVWKNSATF